MTIMIADACLLPAHAGAGGAYALHNVAVLYRCATTGTAFQARRRREHASSACLQTGLLCSRRRVTSHRRRCARAASRSIRTASPCTAARRAAAHALQAHARVLTLPMRILHCVQPQPVRAALALLTCAANDADTAAAKRCALARWS